jgi:hypothetical protein
MESINNNTRWNSQLEMILSQEGEKALCFMWLHARAEKKFAKYDTTLVIPTIIISTISGAASTSIGGLNEYHYLNYIIGAMSLTVSLLSTLGTKFSWGKRSQAHNTASLTYSKIYTFIKIELSLPRSERMSAHDMLKTFREQLARLEEISPRIPDDIIKQFNDKFYEMKNVSKPEITNGLDPISVYVDNNDPLASPPPQPVFLQIRNPPPTPSPVNIAIPTKTSTGDHTPNNLQTSSSAHPQTEFGVDNSHI